MSRAACLIVLCVCGLFTATAALAHAQDLPALLEVNSDRGRIDLGMLGRDGSKVAFFERVAGQLVPIGSATISAPGAPFAFATVLGIATWRCDRLTRRFVAVATAPDGSQTTGEADTRTPNCRHRLEVVVPTKVKRGARVSVTVSDRFRLGGTQATVCAGKQGAKARCRTVRLTRAHQSATVRFRAAGDAVWRVEVRHEGGRIQRVLTVGDARRPAGGTGLPRLLVTGDSLVQVVDAFIGEQLQTAFDITSDARPGTGLVKPTAVRWPALARSQAAKLEPAVTVLFLGTNDGFPIGAVPCCGPDWSAAYARRARGVMRTYVRGTRGRVLWLTVPIPRDPRFAVAARAVNVGLREAVVGQTRVTLVDLDRLLTPGDAYRDAMPIDGRSVRVRSTDGIHLSTAGARYVSGLVVETLRRFRATG